MPKAKHRKSAKRKTHKTSLFGHPRRKSSNPRRFQTRKAKKGSGYVCIDTRTRKTVAHSKSKRGHGGVKSYCDNIAPKRAKPKLGARRHHGTANPKHGATIGARVGRLERLTETLAKSQLMVAKKVEQLARHETRERRLHSGR
jgi:hypothetical protein